MMSSNRVENGNDNENTNAFFITHDYEQFRQHSVFCKFAHCIFVCLQSHSIRKCGCLNADRIWNGFSENRGLFCVLHTRIGKKWLLGHWHDPGSGCHLTENSSNYRRNDYIMDIGRHLTCAWIVITQFFSLVTLHAVSRLSAVWFLSIPAGRIWLRGRIFATSGALSHTALAYWLCSGNCRLHTKFFPKILICWN